MNPVKFLKCVVVGHRLDTPSIVNTIDHNTNWLKRCSCCGLYIMHGGIGSVLLTKKEAFQVKKEFEERFPYSVKGEE